MKIPRVGKMIIGTMRMVCYKHRKVCNVKHRCGYWKEILGANDIFKALVRTIYLKHWCSSVI